MQRATESTITVVGASCLASVARSCGLIGGMTPTVPTSSFEMRFCLFIYAQVRHYFWAISARRLSSLSWRWFGARAPRSSTLRFFCRHGDGGCLSIPFALAPFELLYTLSGLSQLTSRLTSRAIQDLDVVKRRFKTRPEYSVPNNSLHLYYQSIKLT